MAIFRASAIKVYSYKSCRIHYFILISEKNFTIMNFLFNLVMLLAMILCLFRFTVNIVKKFSIVLRKRKKQRERLCRYVYNILREECTQLNGTWPDPRWNSGEYAELLPDWFPTNATNTTTYGNATTSSTGNVIEIKTYSHATCKQICKYYELRISVQNKFYFIAKLYI